MKTSITLTLTLVACCWNATFPVVGADEPVKNTEASPTAAKPRVTAKPSEEVLAQQK